MIKDITQLPGFKEMITSLKSIIRHFSKSSYSVAKLEKETAATSEDGQPAKALQKVGKTRFGTHWSACNSLDPCLPGIRKLVGEGAIKFSVCLT
jgi:hypothetical protein